MRRADSLETRPAPRRREVPSGASPGLRPCRSPGSGGSPQRRRGPRRTRRRTTNLRPGAGTRGPAGPSGRGRVRLRAPSRLPRVPALEPSAPPGLGVAEVRGGAGDATVWNLSPTSPTVVLFRQWRRRVPPARPPHPRNTDVLLAPFAHADPRGSSTDGSVLPPTSLGYRFCKLSRGHCGEATKSPPPSAWVRQKRRTSDLRSGRVGARRAGGG